MSILDRIIGIIAPHSCQGCGIEGWLLCPQCAQLALLVPDFSCYRCGKAQNEAFSACSTCRGSSLLDTVWVRAEYVGAAKELVYALKFTFARQAANEIAGHVAGMLPRLPRDTLIVHVPTISSHVRQRGFDHAALIARELSRSAGLDHWSLLRRHGQKRQVGTSGQARRQQLADAFTVFTPELVTGRQILLVDDVLTTGSTLEAAAQALKVAGAVRVDAAIFAITKQPDQKIKRSVNE